MSKQKICLRRETMELERAIQYLEALTASLKAGAIRVQHGANELTIFPGNIVDIKVEAYKKIEKDKISIDLSWHTKRKEQNGNGFSISSDVSPGGSRPDDGGDMEGDLISGGGNDKPKAKKRKKAKKTTPR